MILADIFSLFYKTAVPFLRKTEKKTKNLEFLDWRPLWSEKDIILFSCQHSRSLRFFFFQLLCVVFGVSSVPTFPYRIPPSHHSPPPPLPARCIFFSMLQLRSGILSKWGHTANEIASRSNEWFAPHGARWRERADEYRCGRDYFLCARAHLRMMNTPRSEAGS